MNKAQILIAAIHGGLITPSDVCRVSRDRRSITLRHCWPQDIDGRAWNTIRRLAERAAREIGGAEILDPRGWIIDVCEP